MKFPKSPFFGSTVNHSIFGNSISHDLIVKTVKFHKILAHLAPKVLLVFTILSKIEDFLRANMDGKPLTDTKLSSFELLSTFDLASCFFILGFALKYLFFCV